MSKIDSVRGVVKTFWTMTLEEWDEMDHKLLRIASGAIGFAIVALFWYYVLRGITPV